MTTVAVEHLEAEPAKAASYAAIACECCGGRNHYRVSVKRGYALRCCCDCGVVFVHPQPTFAQLEALYKKEAGYFCTAETDLKKIPKESALWLDNALIAHGIASGRFLDVGCANGSLIHSMRGLGWDVKGVDLNADAVEIAVKNGLDARVATLETANFPASSFDVVYLGDVIEHVPSPRRTCEEIHRILRPGGLVAMRTPNAACGLARLTLLASRVTGGKLSWAHSEAPYHLHEFTPTSLARLFESVGFEMAWNDCDGNSRFLYKLGATGAFDEVKRQIKQSGAARGGKYRLSKQLVPHLPMLALIGGALLPAYVAGKLFDRLTGSGSAIFIGARKKRNSK